MATTQAKSRRAKQLADPVDRRLPTSIRLSRAERKVIGRAAAEVEETRQDFIVNATMARAGQVLKGGGGA